MMQFLCLLHKLLMTQSTRGAVLCCISIRTLPLENTVYKHCPAYATTPKSQCASVQVLKNPISRVRNSQLSVSAYYQSWTNSNKRGLVIKEIMHRLRDLKMSELLILILCQCINDCIQSKQRRCAICREKKKNGTLSQYILNE